jgi:polysaccharide biosynthesis transport protein
MKQRPSLPAVQMGLESAVPSTQSDASHTFEQAPKLIEYWRAIMLRKWSIAVLALVAAAIGYAWAAQTVPLYRSIATLLIEIDRTKVVPVGEPYSGIGSYYREHFQTQVEVLKSRDVAQRVIAKLKLTQHPEFSSQENKPSAIRAWLAQLCASCTELFTQSTQSEPAGVDETAVFEQFAERLSIVPVRFTELLKVRFDAHDPMLAAAVANATAEAFIEADLEARYTSGDNAGQLIDRRLMELKSRLDASEQALQRYRDQTGLIDNKSMVVNGGTGRQYDELTLKLVDARVRRSHAEEAYNQVKDGHYDSVPAVVNSPAVQRAREMEAEAEKKIAELSQSYGPGHPTLVAAVNDLKATRDNTAKQIQIVVAGVVKEYEAARATEKTLAQELGQSKNTIQHVNRQEIQLGMLERDVATNRQLYQAFLSRARETDASKGAQQPVGRLVDAALPATVPFRPAKRLTVAIAALLGLLLGVGRALLLKSIDKTVKSSADIESKLGRPLLTALPVLEAGDRDGAGRVVLNRPRGIYAESIMTAATGILLSGLDTPCQVLAVTSSVTEEGKSTFAMNLALCQAHLKRVLVLEADLRRPCFSTSLGLSSDRKGLAELISGTCALEDCVLEIAGTTLHAIPCGHIPHNPLELLMSAQFRDLLVSFSERYDTIIIDTPPVQLVSDALVIGAQATGVIFVVKADSTPIPLARTALKRLSAANIPIYGVVLNQQDFKKAEKYYGEYSGYAAAEGYGVKRAAIAIRRAATSAVPGVARRFETKVENTEFLPRLHAMAANWKLNFMSRSGGRDRDFNS